MDFLLGEKSCFGFLALTIFISYVFSCFKFVELLIKITPSVIKIECGTKILGNTCSQSISCFKATRVFNSQLTKKPSSYIHRWSNVTLYLFDFVWCRGAFRTQSDIYNGVFCETLFAKKLHLGRLAGF